MSTPEASSTRQRTSRLDEEPERKTSNPASLSNDPNKQVHRNKPVVKPPFADVTMGKFLTYLVLFLVAIAAFYTYRFTVWAADAGGYWNLVTGRRTSPQPGAVEFAAKVAERAQSAGSTANSYPGSAVGGGGSGKPTKQGTDVQSQIYNLANALGIKPAELSDAIRPLIDPSAPNAAEKAQQEVEILKAQLAASGAAAGGEKEEQPQGSLLGLVGEVLLD
ncbi:hypothetical protein BCR39DRAFT_518571 [Naematelia encephala]|uniref:Uncharacterized protein n=1 Tax=Naematelia encephala TaxID=71784 RepID=A0A1Y2BH37_9TREE|nr:hypothetical protein BCR39DRAFT_518571 [Naematelia encephala]